MPQKGKYDAHVTHPPPPPPPPSRHMRTGCATGRQVRRSCDIRMCPKACFGVSESATRGGSAEAAEANGGAGAADHGRRVGGQHVVEELVRVELVGVPPTEVPPPAG